MFTTVEIKAHRVAIRAAVSYLQKFPEIVRILAAAQTVKNANVKAYVLYILQGAFDNADDSMLRTGMIWSATRILRKPRAVGRPSKANAQEAYALALIHSDGRGVAAWQSSR